MAPFVKSSSTSRASAREIESHLTRIQAEIYEEMQYAGVRGVTCDELEWKLRVRHQTLSARVRELYLLGWIYRTTRTRKTRSGRRAVVYRLRKKRRSSSSLPVCPMCSRTL